MLRPRFFVLGSFSAALLLAVACGTEGTLPGGDSAAGQSSGKGGKGGSAQAGSSGDAGASAGGSTGDGGTSASGAAGTKTSTENCEAGRGDCNVDSSDGCETNLTNSSLHCGACGVACGKAGPNQAISCEESKCVTACDAFSGDCDGDATNGCETDLGSNLAHCGSCDAAPCQPGPHGAASCDGGSCSVTCETGFGNCDGDPANGCEADFATDLAHCGACGGDCEGGTCKGGVCECAASTTIAEVLPLDIHVMLDKSASMDEDVAGTQSKWDLATAALKDFIGSVTVDDKMGMGFALFPAKSSCNVALYDDPVVNVGDLPGNATALTSAITSAKPNGSDTPTLPALTGAIEFGKKRLQVHPDRKIAIVLATDGDPTDCSFSFPPKDVSGEITKVAKAGLDAGVPTYVIGVFASGSSSGSAKSSCDKWASAGGTKKAYIVDADPNLSANLKKALDEIRTTAVGCEYKLPTPTNGKALDPGKVNVTHTPGGGTDNPLVYVADPSACTPNAWYYDNPASPKKILLCPALCDVVKPDQAGKVSISVGCATRIDQ
jgi:hypothetical protein